MPLETPESETHLQRLVWALEHPVQEMRFQAVLLLGALGDVARPALPDLFRAYRETGDIYFRRSVVEAIAAIGGAVGDGFLPEALGDKSVIVRSAAVAAISKKLHWIHPDVQERVIQSLGRTAERDASQSVRDAARSALGDLGRQRRP